MKKRSKYMMTHICRSIITHALGRIPPPYFLTYLITKRCNARCFFCDVWRHEADADKELTLDEIETVFRKLTQCDVIRVSGGEPFIRNDITAALVCIERIVSPRIVHITTNGFLTERIVETVLALKNPRALHLKVSLDSVEKRHDEIRQVQGAYQKAMATVDALVRIRESLPLTIGVNCAVVNEGDLDGFVELANVMRKKRVPVYAVIANRAENALYGHATIVSPDHSVDPIGNFSHEGIRRFIRLYRHITSRAMRGAERIVDAYHMKGLENRLLHGRRQPRPRCVALTSHIRLMPNGDIPVCLYNSTAVGNLVRDSLDDVWFSREALKEHRAWVRNCAGCWQSCETAVSAIYTGDIMKGMLW